MNETEPPANRASAASRITPDANMAATSGGAISTSEARLEEPVGPLESKKPSQPPKRASRWGKKTVLTPERTPNDRAGWLHGPDCRCAMLACRAERNNPPT